MKKLLLYSVAISMFAVTGCKKDDEKKNNDDNASITVPKENKSLTQKVTGTKCPPCGSWGWTMMDELMTFGVNKSIFISTYSQNFVAEGFITNVASEMDDKWGITGYPTFVVNGSPKLSRTSTGVNTTQEKQMCKDAMDAHANAEVVGNIGLVKSFSGETLTVKTKTQFFVGSEGTYNIALYVVEDGAMWKQSGHATGASTAISHHHVLRAAINGTWGEQIMSGTIASGQVTDKTFTYNLNPSWNKDKIEVVAVLWKVDGSNYIFVNANKI